MKASGIGTVAFKPHTTRAASASKAKMKTVPIEEILVTAGWSSDSTFARHNNLPIVSNSNITFAQQVLKQ
jgi:hypothetical protein